MFHICIKMADANDDIPNDLQNIVDQINNEMMVENSESFTNELDDDPFLHIRMIDDFVEFFTPLNDALRRLNQTHESNEAENEMDQHPISSDHITPCVDQLSSAGVTEHSGAPTQQMQTEQLTPSVELLSASVMSEHSAAPAQQVQTAVMTEQMQTEPSDAIASQYTDSGKDASAQTASQTGVEQPPAESDESYDPQVGGEIIKRDKFNTVEIRQELIPPSNDRPTDFSVFYNDVMVNIERQVDNVLTIATPGDIIQIELIGPDIRQHDILQAGDAPEDIHQGFQNLFDRAVQSNTEILCDSSLELVVKIVKDKRGGARRKLQHTLDSEVITKKRRCLYIPPPQNNNLCLATALTGLMHDSLTMTGVLARSRDLQAAVGLSEHTPAGFGDIHKFERVLNRKIVVLYRNEAGKPMSHFETDTAKSTNSLVVYLHEEHFYGVKNPAQFVGYSYFCRGCYRGYQDVHTHRCANHCHICANFTCPQTEPDPIRCRDCDKTCHNRACFDKHKDSSPLQPGGPSVSICDRYKKCHKCGLTYYISNGNQRKAHTCPAVKCQVCHMSMATSDQGSSQHQCYIQPEPSKPPNTRLIFYDFETYLSDEGVHVPFLVCTKSLGGVEKYWYGPDCCVKFIQHFRSPRYKNHTLIAHNSRGFDSYILIAQMLRQGLNLRPIMQGSKVICLTEVDYNLRFIDSLSFLTMKLSAMPKAMGFEDRMKGHFPHKFSSHANLNYVGPYPSPEFYGVDRMSPDEREKFSAWYDVACRSTFDFKKEALLYCRNDVTILAAACQKFRDVFLKATAVDPFTRATIASACMTVFRTNYLTPDTLAITPPDNYRRQHKAFSHDSIQYLQWVSHKNNIHIKHALNGGEQCVSGHYIDGFFLDKDGLIHLWEYEGCFFHGCPTCFDLNRLCPMTSRSFGEMYADCRSKHRLLRADPKVRLTVMWEHEWLDMKQNDPEVREFLSQTEYPKPLEPRDALFGGRTNAFVLRHSAQPDERILYVDVTSLYPFVNHSCRYPIGHPRIIREDFGELKKFFGFVRAEVYPPRRLYHPVLPHRVKRGKLVFTLCRTCAEINNQTSECAHDDAARSLTGVWTTFEFQKAIDLGYKIARITEVWHFEQSSTEIFKKYISTFLKDKQEASGFPVGVVTAADKQQYIHDYALHQGIQLDGAAIQINPGRRSVSKICLNSLWGKFAQRDNLRQTQFVRDEGEFFRIMFSGMYEIKYFDFINDDVALIQYNFRKNNIVPSGPASNVFIACMTTSYARMIMYEYLEQLKERVLYTDTDSLVYLVRNGESELQLGDYLGCLTDELKSDTILEFVSAGPKSYAYQTRQGRKVTMKVKGLTLSYECSQIVNFDSFKRLVDNYVDNLGAVGGANIVAPQHTIVRDKRGFHLKNVSFHKRVRVVYDKRRLLAEGKTLPFGY